MSGTVTPTSDGTASTLSLEEEEDRELLHGVDEGEEEWDSAGKSRSRLETEAATAYVWFIAGMISISGLLFGLDTGIISGVLVNIHDDLGHDLSAGNKELITSATTAAAFLGGIGSGVISDQIGRRWLLTLADITFILGALLQAMAHDLFTITSGRAILGLGVGMASCVCPLLISELAPTHLRGRLVTVNVIAITLGQVVAYAIGAIFEHSPSGWRWMSGLCAVPAGLQLCALFFLPDSPRQLILHGRIVEARATLQKIYFRQTITQVETQIAEMQADAKVCASVVASQPLRKRLRILFTIGSHRRALIIACGLQLFQQLSGFNTLMYYSATLFASIGFNNPTAVGLFISGTNFIGTLIALRTIDSIGRRRTMLFTAPGMALGLLMASIAFYYLTLHTNGRLDPFADYPASWSGLVLFSMIFYVFAYATGIGNVPWLQSELFSIAYRGIGTSLSTGCNWAANLIIGSTYLTLMDAITPSGAFALYGGICFVGWIFVLLCYPETAGLDIEEIQVIFEKDFGIRVSEKLRAEKKDTELHIV